ncbi:MAG: hypothetical protein P8Z79_17025, partial [Sedimentisphaerales bacterium]
SIFVVLHAFVVITYDGITRYEIEFLRARRSRRLVFVPRGSSLVFYRGQSVPLMPWTVRLASGSKSRPGRIL